MKTGLVISGAAHAGLLGVALFQLSAPRPLDTVAPPALPVELVSIESVTKVMQGAKDAKPKAKPTPQKSDVDVPKPVAAKPAKKPPVEKAAAPKPEPKPQPKPQAKPEPKPEPKPVETAALPKPVTTQPVRPKPTPPKPTPPKPVAEPKPAVEPKPTDVKPAVADTPDVPAVEPVEKAEPKQTLPTQVATPKSRPRPPKPVEPKRVEPKPVKKAKPEPEVRTAKADAKPQKPNERPKKADSKSTTDQIKALLDKRKASGGAKKSTETASLGTAKGTALTMSASELDALKAQIRACWSVQGGGADADSLRAKVSFKLDRSGAIVSDPVAGGTGGDSARARRAFARSALRAVKRCAPYKLPADKYETWADVTVNFSLADML